MSNLRLSITVILLWSFMATAARADRRSYVWTYEYQTVERGEAALETFFTVSAPDIDSLENNTSSEHQVEIEVGMNERFDFGIYQVFSQDPYGSLRYDGFKLESRYRFGEKGDYPLDPLIYLEYKGEPDLSEHGFEIKFILARDFGPTNVSLNPILEFETGREAEAEYAIGVGRTLSRLLRIGIEAKGSDKGNYIGPVISHGADHIWVTLGSAFGIGHIDDGEPEFQLRLLLGMEL